MTRIFALHLSAHGKAMLLAFEIFWVVVFILERVSGESSNGIPQFIYVNF